MLVRLRNRDKTSEMQMAAAKCLTYLYRGGALNANDPIIMLKVSFDFFQLRIGFSDLHLISFKEIVSRVV